MIEHTIRDASAPLAEALKGADALGVAPSRLNVRFRRNGVVVSLTDQVPAELVGAVWELLREEFSLAGWGYRIRYDGDVVTETVFDHPIELTRIG